MPAGRDSVEAQVREIAERVAASEGLELVDVEWRSGGRGSLRIFIDKPEGVTLADCETVSRQVSTILDVADVAPGGAYSLEVSSPGLDRKLTRPEDYRRFAGRKAKLKLREPVEGRQQFTGRLVGLDNEEVVLEIDAEQEVRFGLGDVKTARLVAEV